MSMQLSTFQTFPGAQQAKNHHWMFWQNVFISTSNSELLEMMNDESVAL